MIFRMNLIYSENEEILHKKKVDSELQAYKLPPHFLKCGK